MTIQFLRRLAPSRAVALLLGALVAGPATATVELRVEARPIGVPIQIFVSVTDDAGDPVSGLAAANFTISIDGETPITIQDAELAFPPGPGSDQEKVSVVFAMDYSQSVQDMALGAMQDAVIAFVDSMNDGDYAAIVKFNGSNQFRASVVLPFTQIDHTTGNDALRNAVMSPYDGDATNLLDAIDVSINHFLTFPGPLPAGPKAIILISDGGDNDSDVTEAEVIALANANSIPIFSVGVGNISIPGSEELLTSLASETGGEFFAAPSDAEITEAYASISERLNSEYLISISSGIDDCAVHPLQVAVQNQVASVTFTRRICDTEPNPFTFTNQTDVAPDSGVISNTVTITGIEVPADISTQIGTYSIGCNGTFTSVSGTINNGQTVCVRHTSSAAASTSNTTTLTIGGVSGSFTSTTRAASGGGGGGGGGGATGGLDLLAGLAALFMRRRRRV